MELIVFQRAPLKKKSHNKKLNTTICFPMVSQTTNKMELNQISRMALQCVYRQINEQVKTKQIHWLSNDFDIKEI